MRLLAAERQRSRAPAPPPASVTHPKLAPQPPPRAPALPPLLLAAVAPRSMAAARRTPSPAVTTTMATSALSSSASTAPEVAAAPPPNADTEQAPPIEYLRRLARIISTEQQCPQSTRLRRRMVVVRLHLNRNGHVISAYVTRSSGSRALDAEAVDVMFRIARFPPFPYDYQPRTGVFDIDQPVTCGLL
ncbi:TonB family protein [Solimonas marina]|uniref:TonB family protein n=1 Tax=Solimonas marina TaxID=2714601 RepID=UPI00344FC0D8